MNKKKKRKVYKFSDVITVRLSPDSRCTQEVLDWINKDDRKISEDFIEAIKLQIAIEEKMSDKVINEIVEKTTLEDGILLQEEISFSRTKIKSEPAEANIQVEENKNLTNTNEMETNVEDEIFGVSVQDIGKKTISPGMRAMRSIQRGNQ